MDRSGDTGGTAKTGVTGTEVKRRNGVGEVTTHPPGFLQEGREQHFWEGLYKVELPSAKHFSKCFKAAFKLRAAGGGGAWEGGGAAGVHWWL